MQVPLRRVSSAGAHLASMAALTPNDPAFQPGFEDADSRVTAAVCLYSYFGDQQATGPVPSSPETYVGRVATPFLVAHGEKDPLIPAGDADHFVQRLRECPARPVAYLRLPALRSVLLAACDIPFRASPRSRAVPLS